ncbi:protein rolling stone-like [Plodia interpunctella]|uniref:protein rolling stone-like n=1 Tax=Plodia interpunctella TaxID=58824 RepID=UPI002368ECF5|nr:protein rolling stone-like [Plodia interpunctella]
MWYLDNEDGSDGSEFWLSSFQKDRSALPLLLIRLVIFLACVGMLIATIVLSIITEQIDARYWPIYMTHWGIITYTLCTFFGCWVSIAAFTGSIDCSSGLPWYVKAYWFWYNVALPFAFFITAFYYTFLSAIVHTFAYIDPILDVVIHGMSSILMMILLLTARHPSRFLHFYQPFSISLVYLLFTIIYYLVGGTDPNGNVWIYPNIDWSKTGPTTRMIIGSTVVFLTLHFMAVLISMGRDWLSNRYIRNETKMQGIPESRSLKSEASGHKIGAGSVSKKDK